MISIWLVIVGLFFYFLFLWLFRLVFILLIAKIVSEAGKAKIDTLKRGIEHATSDARKNESL